MQFCSPSSVLLQISSAHLTAEELCELKVCSDDEEPVVVEVGDDGPVVGGETDASRGVKVTPQGPVVPVLDDKVPGW